MKLELNYIQIKDNFVKLNSNIIVKNPSSCVFLCVYVFDVVYLTLN